MTPLVSLLVAGWAGAPLFARVGHEHLVLAVRAAYPGKALLEIPTLEKGRHGTVHDRSPETVFGLETLGIHLPEGRKVPIQQSPQV